MSLNVRLTAQDQRLYNPSRDIAHAFGGMVRLVAKRLEEESWPELAKLLKDRGVSQDELGEACGAFCRFVLSSVEKPDESMKESLTRSGWDEVKPEAQIAYLAILGTVVAGYFWGGVREVTIGGRGPVDEVQDLHRLGDEARQLLSQSLWRRRLNRWKRYLSPWGR